MKYVVLVLVSTFTAWLVLDSLKENVDTALDWANDNH